MRGRQIARSCCTKIINYLDTVEVRSSPAVPPAIATAYHVLISSKAPSVALYLIEYVFGRHFDSHSLPPLFNGLPIVLHIEILGIKPDTKPGCWLNSLEPRLVESRTTVVIPFDYRVIFVRLLNRAEFPSRLSEVAQTLDPISRTQFHIAGGGFGERWLLGTVCIRCCAGVRQRRLGSFTQFWCQLSGYKCHFVVSFQGESAAPFAAIFHPQ